jgi:hypothetical protein
MAEKKESARETVSERYCGHDIDFNTAVDRFEIMQEGADPNPSPLDDDTEVKLGPKEPENPNDPYCVC